MVFESLVAPLAAFLGPPAPPLAPLLAPVPQFYGQGVVRTTLYAGIHGLNSDFDPADDQKILGIDIDVREPAGTTGFEAGYFRSFGDGSANVGAGSVDVESCVNEFWCGARWTFEPWLGHVRPYVGMGGSFLYGTFDTDGFGGSTHGSGWALGVYGHGGLEWNFSGGWAVGLDLRALVSTDTDLQASVSFDYTQAAFTVSWAW
jgi:hypothetical protein